MLYFYRTAEIMLGNCESMATIGDKSDQSKGASFYHFIISRWILDTPSFLISMGISLMTSFTCLSLFNTFIQWTGTLFGFVNFGLVMIMTYFFIPFLYLLGIPWIQIFQVTLFFLIIFLIINDLAPNVCN